MRLEYLGKDTYDNWAMAIWNKGYTMPITDIPSLIGVSLSWIKQTLCKHINYVVYDNKWIYKRTGNHCLTYINKDDLSKYIMENATYEIQTEIVDLSYCLAPFKSDLNKCISLYKTSLETYKNRGYYTGTMPTPVLEYIKDNFVAINVNRNWSCKERSMVKWVSIKPFDIFQNQDRIYFKGGKNKASMLRCHLSPKTNGIKSCNNNETLYRAAFLNGDIKIKLGNQITIFYVRNQKVNEMKLPYLVPYGTEIKLYKSK